MFKRLAWMFLVAIPAAAAAPADVTGTWAISGEVQGVAVVETCSLKQSADAKITGSCDTSTGKYDVTGTVENGTAAFHHGGKYEGNALTITYTGKLGDDGSMAGTFYVDAYDVTGSFSAKKSVAAP